MRNLDRLVKRLGVRSRHQMACSPGLSYDCSMAVEFPPHRRCVDARLRVESLFLRASHSADRYSWLTSASHTKVKNSLIMLLSCGNTLKSPRGARTFWVRGTASASAGQS